jgi:hypothetical protein
LPDIIGYAVQAVYTGTPNGTIKLQASVDPFKYVVNGGLQAPTHWADIPSSSITLNAAGVYIWNITDVYYTFVRVVYTDASGGTSTAVLNVNICTKGV